MRSSNVRARKSNNANRNNRTRVLRAASRALDASVSQRKRTIRSRSRVFQLSASVLSFITITRCLPNDISIEPTERKRNKKLYRETKRLNRRCILHVKDATQKRSNHSSLIPRRERNAAGTNFQSRAPPFSLPPHPLSLFLSIRKSRTRYARARSTVPLEII